MLVLKEAENALKYYKGYKGKSLEESRALTLEFQRLKNVIEQQRLEKRLQLNDLCECIIFRLNRTFSMR